MRRYSPGMAVAIGVLVLTWGVVPARSQTSDVTGMLPFHAVFAMTSDDGACPAGYNDLVECHPRKGEAVVPGLGIVTETYDFPVLPGPPACTEGHYRVLDYTVRFAVAGKGTLTIAVPGASECLQFYTWPSPHGTIIGGSGLYAGATGVGTVTTITHESSVARLAGFDTWVGALTVPGLAFDLTPPILTGARNKRVHAPKGTSRVRVRYGMSAHDEVDGVVPVTCKPKSGSWFRVGRKIVACSAMDTSGNIQTAKLTVTVTRPKRA